MTQISTASEPRTALFPGSFRPFTRGHADIVERALELFDHIIIAIGVNPDKPAADREAAAEAIRRYYRDEPRIEVAVYSSLTTDFAAECGARFLLRGVRSVKDFEYERDMAQINRQLSGIETVILYSSPEYAAFSSSVVRELQAYGHDITPFLPSEK